MKLSATNNNKLYRHLSRYEYEIEPEPVVRVVPCDGRSQRFFPLLSTAQRALLSVRTKAARPVRKPRRTRWHARQPLIKAAEYLCRWSGVGKSVGTAQKSAGHRDPEKHREDRKIPEDNSFRLAEWERIIMFEMQNILGRFSIGKQTKQNFRKVVRNVTGKTGDECVRVEIRRAKLPGEDQIHRNTGRNK